MPEPAMNQRSNGYTNQPAEGPRLDSQRYQAMPGKQVNNFDRPNRTDDDKHRLQFFGNGIHWSGALYHSRIPNNLRCRAAPMLSYRRYRDPLLAPRNHRGPRYAYALPAEWPLI